MDPPSFTELYTRFSPVIYRRAFSLLKDAEEAWDLTHDTFVAYRQQSRPVRSLSEASAFLFVIVDCKTFNRLRGRARWSGQLTRYLSVDVLQELDKSELEARRIEVARDLALLTRREKKQTLNIAVLRYVEGCTLTEIGDAVRLDRKAVGRILEDFRMRALKRSRRFGYDPK